MSKLLTAALLEITIKIKSEIKSSGTEELN